MPRKSWSPALLFFLLTASAGCVSAPKDGAKPSDSAAPDFELKDLSGATAKLGDFRGKVVLLDFWATWCGPCKESIPRYKKLAERYRSNGLLVVGIDVAEDSGVVRAFAKDHQMDYPILLDSGKMTFDSYGASGLPTVFLIDGDGRIRRRWSGFDESIASDVERAVSGLLEPREP